MKTFGFNLVFGMVFLFSGYLWAQPKTVTRELCSGPANNDAAYLQEFVVKPDMYYDSPNAPFAKYTMMLSKKTVYRFSVCASDEPGSLPVLQLYNNSTLVASTYNPESGKNLTSFDFVCNKTDVYHLIISYQDGKKGNALAVLWYVKTL